MHPYEIKVTVKKMQTSDWLSDYCFPERFQEACKQCPEYDRSWSCPPGLPDGNEYLGRFQTIYLIAVQVIYDPAFRSLAAAPALTEKLRQSTYGEVKKMLLRILLELEDLYPGSLTLGAGRCELCKTCTRKKCMPCIHPEKRRYSITAFGADMAKLNQSMGIQLKWAKDGLPEYDVAVAAFLTERT